jgi:hypothetical protein
MQRRSRQPFALTGTGSHRRGQNRLPTLLYQCHGPNFDGYGTVGQSFAPPPGDLRTAKIQSMSPGSLFKEISYGIPDGRQPALATTMTAGRTLARPSPWSRAWACATDPGNQPRAHLTSPSSRLLPAMNESTCHLCGLPLALRCRCPCHRRSTLAGSAARAAGWSTACCWNRPRWTIRRSFKETDLYRQCVAAGVIPASEDDLQRINAREKQESKASAKPT